MARPLLPLSGFRSFEAAARHLSFAKAADELRVTPAAISHQVRTLEDYLGVKLFQRTGRAVALTEAGRMLLPDLRAGFDLFEAGLTRLKRQARDGGALTVSMSPSFASKWFVPRLERFSSARPDIDVRVETSGRLVDFTADQVDAGIRYGLGGYDGLEAIRLFGEEIFPVCSPATAAKAALREPSDLARCTLIHDESNGGDPTYPGWREWLGAAAAVGVDPERGLRFGLSAMATQAAIDGQGVLLGRSVLISDDLAQGRLVRPFDLSLPVRPGYWFVCPPGGCDRPLVAEFRDWILEEAGAAAAA